MSKVAALRRGRSLGDKVSGEGVVHGNVFDFYKTRHILLSDSANCTVLRTVVLTQYRRVTDRRTDGQMDGIAVASTALAMRALRRAVKRESTSPIVVLFTVLIAECMKITRSYFRTEFRPVSVKIFL